MLSLVAVEHEDGRKRIGRRRKIRRRIPTRAQMPASLRMARSG